jgi:hypothetical protein
MLCRTARDTVFRRGYYNREIWKPAIQTAGLLADTTFHDLRHLVPEASARARTALDGAFAAARARAADAPPAGACATDVQRTPACDHEAQVRRRKRGESACRPGSVPPLARGDGHPSGTAVADSLVRSTREHRAGSPRALAQADCLSRRPS